MICLKYNVSVDERTLDAELKKLINQIYKLLPQREEDKEWKLLLDTVIEEFAGLSRLWKATPQLSLALLSKLEGLFTLDNEEDFFLYRRTIFDCLQLLEKIRSVIK